MKISTKLLVFVLLSVVYSSPVFSKGGRAPVISDWLQLKRAADSGILTSIYAKEMCSCHFISNIPVADCKARALVGDTQAYVSLTVSERDKTIRATMSPLAIFFTALGPSRTARFNTKQPRLGCSLVEP